MTTLNKENLSPAAFIGVRGKDIISFGSGEPNLPPPEDEYLSSLRLIRNYQLRMRIFKFANNI
mgnify:FL=1